MENDKMLKENGLDDQQEQFGRDDLIKVLDVLDKYKGVLSLLGVLTVTIGNVIIQGIFYFRELGIVDYYKVPRSMIIMADENKLYELLRYGGVSLYVVLANVIEYCFVKAKIKKRVVLAVSALFAFLFGLLSGFKQMYILETQHVGLWIIVVCVAMITGMLLSIPMFIAGFVVGCVEEKIRHWKANGKKENVKKKEEGKVVPLGLREMLIILLVAVLLGCILEAVIFYGNGYSVAKKKEVYMIVEDLDEEKNTKYAAVLYENGDYFIVSECELVGTDEFVFIDMYHHKIVGKENVSYTYKTKKLE